MNLCALCGAQLFDARLEACAHHFLDDSTWGEFQPFHVYNKVFCDWLHRGVEPPPVKTTIVQWEECDVVAMFA